MRIIQDFCKGCILYLLVWLWVGLRIKHKEKLPLKGPAIIVANHNSHMDTFILLSLFPLLIQKRIHPVAAEDYFLKNRWLSWFTRNILNIIPISRYGDKKDPLLQCRQALNDGKILILFPEGTRGEPGKLSPFKTGVWYLISNMLHVPVIPVWISGTEHIMTKNNCIPFPLFIDVNIGDSVSICSNKKEFMSDLQQKLLMLRQQIKGKYDYE